MSFVCPKCDKSFAKNAWLQRHLARKTPCALIVDTESLPDEKKDSPNKCKFCGRAFSTRAHLYDHLKKTCKVAPRDGNTTGMEKLYEYTLRKQQAQIDQQRHELEELKAHVQSGVSTQIVGTTQPKQAIIARTANVDQSVTITNNTINNNISNISINVFGREKIDRITKPQVFDILRGLGQVGDNVKAIAEKAILRAAMLIFSDPAHPEDITCYLPNKKGDSALVHGEAGWEVQPIGLVVSPMATKAIDAIFAKQPAPDTETPANDVKWIMEECAKILRYIVQHEGDLTNELPRGEVRGILIRNKELLHQVLKKLPLAGQKSQVVDSCPALLACEEKKAPMPALAPLRQDKTPPFTCQDALSLLRAARLPEKVGEADVVRLMTTAQARGVDGSTLIGKLRDVLDDNGELSSQETGVIEAVCELLDVIMEHQS